jgi:hypothetical protein
VSTRSQKQYARLVATRKCTKCRAGLLDEEIYTYCDICRERHLKYTRSKRRLRKDRQRNRKNYLKERKKRLKDHADRRLAKKLRGECRDCPNPSLEDSLFCSSHRKLRRSASLAWWQEKGYERRKAQRLVETPLRLGLETRQAETPSNGRERSAA